MTLEEKILEKIRKSGNPLSQDEVVATMEDEDSDEVRQSLRFLGNRGEIRVLLDWKVRIR